jgi:hypothetical protein
MTMDISSPQFHPQKSLFTRNDIEATPDSEQAAQENQETLELGADREFSETCYTGKNLASLMKDKRFMAAAMTDAGQNAGTASQGKDPAVAAASDNEKPPQQVMKENLTLEA